MLTNIYKKPSGKRYVPLVYQLK